MAPTPAPAVRSATVIRFVVRGLPIPQGSKQAQTIRPHDGREPFTVLIDANARALKDWRSAIAAAAGTAWRSQPLLGPLACRLDFYFIRPASQTRAERAATWRAKTPDVDKLARACLDGMTKVVYRDDAQIVWLRVTKRYAEGPHLPGVEATVRELR